MAEFLNGRTWQVCEKCLETASLRQRVVAHNVANIDTPGYKQSFVEFEEALQAALANSPSPLVLTNPRHLKPVPRLETLEPRVVPDKQGPARPDGNNVDLTAQMLELSKNVYYYQVVAQAVNGRLANLRYVISGGRR